MQWLQICFNCWTYIFVPLKKNYSRSIPKNYAFWSLEVKTIRFQYRHSIHEITQTFFTCLRKFLDSIILQKKIHLSIFLYSVVLELFPVHDIRGLTRENWMKYTSILLYLTKVIQKFMYPDGVWTYSFCKRNLRVLFFISH